jgi:drug/metabolite transporter (DMT)-like permease
MGDARAFGGTHDRCLRRPAPPHPDQRDGRATWAALAYVVVIGSVVVFLLHVWVAQQWTASRAAYVMVTTPLVTIVLSAWLDQEPVTGGLLLGGALVLGGVYLGALRAGREDTAAS